MAPVGFTLKVVAFGATKPVVNTFIFVERDEDEAAQHLRTIIRNEVADANNGIEFSATDDEINQIIGSGGSNLRRMLDPPLRVFPPQFEEVIVKIMPTIPAQAEEEEEEGKIVDLVEENKEVMTFLQSKYTMDHVRDFQERFENRSMG